MLIRISTHIYRVTLFSAECVYHHHLHCSCKKEQEINILSTKHHIHRPPLEHGLHPSFFTRNSKGPTTKKESKMALTCSDILKIILAIILPPLGVLIEKGCGADLLINIALTFLGFIPGIIHALYIILKY
ncbi:unnamed protein product [Orchesella dallaii]|uniref:Plasma membrane proteolipid 3 n=1 Tax=Orchesella dallaii TaxID=48710 RepID=A0ABP1S323_9HEXA